MSPSRPETRHLKSLSAVAAIAAGLGLLLMGWAVLPVPDRDASYFVGTSVSLGSGDGFTNRHDALVMSQDPEDQARYLSYPPAFPLVVGLLGGGTVRGNTMVIAFLAAAAVFLCSLLFAATSDVTSGPARWAAALATVAFATAFSNGAQRPEALSAVLVLLGALALRRAPDRLGRDVLIGALLGVLLHVQITVTLYAAAALVAHVAYGQPTKRALGALARGAASAMAVASLGLWLHPYGGRAYVEAFLQFASFAASQSQARFVGYWILGVRFPGLLPTLLLAVGLTAWGWWRASQRAQSPVLMALAVLAGTALFVRYAMMQPPRWYDATCFLPFLYAAILRSMSRPPEGGAAARWLVIAAFAVIGANTLGYARRLGMALPALTGASSYAGASAQLRRDLQALGARGMVATTPQAWMLLPDVRWGCVMELPDGFKDGTSCRVLPGLLVVQQARFAGGAPAPGHLRIAPRLFDRALGAADSTSWVLVRSRFAPAAGATGVLARQAASAWGYAIYRRTRLEPRRVVAAPARVPWVRQ